MKSLAVVGAGGHTRSTLNLLRPIYASEQLAIYDDSFSTESAEWILDVPVVGNLQQIPTDCEVFLSVGDVQQRYMHFLKYRHSLLEKNLVHPSALFENRVETGVANQFFAKVYINNAVKLGDNNIVNSAAIIEHEAIIGSHNHLAVGCKICGRVRLGNRCFIGAGAVIIDKVTICDDVTVGAGAVVVDDILEPGTYVGVPARKIK